MHPQSTQHLGLLAVFHYVGAVLVGLTSLFPLFHLAIGVLILSDSQSAGSAPLFVGEIMVVVAAALICAGLFIACLMVAAGRNLRRGRYHTFCLVVAGIECLFFPVGTVLGVLTILALIQPGVKEAFDGRVG